MYIVYEKDNKKISSVAKVAGEKSKKLQDTIKTVQALRGDTELSVETIEQAIDILDEKKKWTDLVEPHGEPRVVPTSFRVRERYGPEQPWCDFVLRSNRPKFARARYFSANASRVGKTIDQGTMKIDFFTSTGRGLVRLNVRKRSRLNARKGYIGNLRNYRNMVSTCSAHLMERQPEKVVALVRNR
jgi:hypothetical protein